MPMSLQIGAHTVTFSSTSWPSAIGNIFIVNIVRERESLSAPKSLFLILEPEIPLEPVRLSYFFLSFLKRYHQFYLIGLPIQRGVAEDPRLYPHKNH